MIQIDYDLKDIVICALRYAIGRKTYVTEEVCGYIKEHPELIDERVKTVMLRDLEDLGKYYEKNDIDYVTFNNLRKWFSADDYKPYSKTNEILVPNISNNKLLNASFVKNIDSNDIRNAVDFIKSNDNKDRKFDIFINEDDYKDLENKKKEKKNKNKRVIEIDSQNEVDNKNELNESKQNENSAGLDLDEIHNMNIMNGIIKSLDNIIYNQNRIIELLSKQSLSKQNFLQNNPQSKQSFSERKLGRFKVEKYKPNMSITEFKKLFNKED